MFCGAYSITIKHQHLFAIKDFAMKIKTTAKELKNADVRFISLVKRGANRLPFRILKSEGESQMIDLTTLRPILKGEKIEAPRRRRAVFAQFHHFWGAALHATCAHHPPPVKIAPSDPCNQLQGRPLRVRRGQKGEAGKRITYPSNPRLSPARATRLNSLRFEPRLIPRYMSNAIGKNPSASMQAVAPSAVPVHGTGCPQRNGQRVGASEHRRALGSFRFEQPHP